MTVLVDSRLSDRLTVFCLEVRWLCAVCVVKVGACVLAHCERVRKTAVFFLIARLVVAPCLRARGTSQPAQKSHEQNFTCCREDSENDAGQVARFFALFAFRSFLLPWKTIDVWKWYYWFRVCVAWIYVAIVSRTYANIDIVKYSQFAHARKCVELLARFFSMSSFKLYFN